MPVARALVLALLGGVWTGFVAVGSDGKSISMSATGEGLGSPGSPLGAEDAAVNTYGKGQDGSWVPVSQLRY